MGRQKHPRPNKRHLVRWSDEKDKQLLLVIQSVCNTEGVKLPWDKIGALMGDQISDGAVIQHLAKIRQRRVSQGLSVPPPLRRGGSNVISTATSGSASVTRSAVVKSAKPKKATESLDTVDENDEDEEEFDVDNASDSEEDFGHTQSKRMKRNTKGGSTRVKSQDSEVVSTETSYQVGDKRKRVGNTATKVEDKRKETRILEAKPGKNSKPKGWTKKAHTRRTGTKNETALFDDSNDDVDEYSDSNVMKVNERKSSQGRNQYVAAGAEFLKLDESEGGSENEVQSSSNQFSGRVGVTVLKFGDSQHAKSVLRGLEPTDGAEDAEVESNYSQDLDDSNVNDHADEESASVDANEEFALVDADVDFSMNFTNTNEPPQANYPQAAHENPSFTPSFGHTFNNFDTFDDARDAVMAHGAHSESSHLQYENSLQQHNDLGLGYSESANQGGGFGTSSRLDLGIGSGYSVASNIQNVEPALPNHLTSHRSFDWPPQPELDPTYLPPTTTQHLSAATEAHDTALNYPHGDNSLNSGDLMPSLPREMARSNSCYDDNALDAQYGHSGYNNPGYSNQPDYFLEAQRSLTSSPLPVHVPQQANLPNAPLDSFSGSTTNFNPTPWSTSPGLLDDFGAPFDAQGNLRLPSPTYDEAYDEEPNDTHNPDGLFDEFLNRMEDVDDNLGIRFKNDPL